MDNKRRIAVFDFDGTLTTTDTMIDFIRYAKGQWRCYAGLLLFAPLIAVMFMRIFDNNRCKELLLSWYFRGMSHERFKQLGEEYAARATELLRSDTVAQLNEKLAGGWTVYVVSASIREWVAPVCRQLGVKDVLATEMEVGADGRLTGRFANHNCYGPEKVNRLTEMEPDRRSYYLYACGDSRGDREMFLFADEYCKV